MITIQYFLCTQKSYLRTYWHIGVHIAYVPEWYVLPSTNIYFYIKVARLSSFDKITKTGKKEGA